MKKFAVSYFPSSSAFTYEEVLADYYYLEEGFTHFVISSAKRDDRVLSVPSVTITRIEYIGEHTE